MRSVIVALSKDLKRLSQCSLSACLCYIQIPPALFFFNGHLILLLKEILLHNLK